MQPNTTGDVAVASEDEVARRLAALEADDVPLRTVIALTADVDLRVRLAARARLGY